MRDLDFSELQFVSGANRAPSGPSGCGCAPCGPSSGRRKGNNGFGNQGNDPAPGNSGTNNAPNAQQKWDDRVR